MRFRQLNDGACKTYLVAAENGDAALVDPLLGREDHYLAELRSEGLTLRYVIDTHVHADHLSGCARLRDLSGADHVVHADSRIQEGSLRVTEGRSLALGDAPIEVLHTPGHTADSMSLRLPEILLTGDFLFLGEGGAGRTDLPGGDPGAHWDSLQKLRDLPDALLVLPGHDYRGNAPSTLGQQRRDNPRLRPMGRAAYVALLQGLKLPAAEWMGEVVKANLRCTRDPRCVEIPAGGAVCEVGAGCSDVATLSCEAYASLLEGGAARPFLLDVRNPDEFTGPLGHLDGATLIPLPELAGRLQELEAQRHLPLLTYCKAGGRSAQAARILMDAGFTQVRSLAGGMGRWNQLGLPVVG